LSPRARRHEGAGSLFAALKARRWASGLSAGQSGGSFSARSAFNVHVDLTDEGAQPGGVELTMSTLLSSIACSMGGG